MKQILNFFVNYGWFALAISIALISGCSCSAQKPIPDPLAGWKLDLKEPGEAISKDYKEYIHNLPPNEGGYYLGPVSYYEDETGQYAIKIQTNENNECWYRVLIYDKENKRIKTIKYFGGRYMS